MSFSRTLRIIRRRRAELAAHFDPEANLAPLEESCIPSYCHRNVLAAGVAWWRLAKAAALCRGWSDVGPVLDFGSATGEIAHLLGDVADYRFVEGDEALAAGLLRWNPGAKRERLDALPAGHFRTVLALDSLEHNDDLDAILSRLVASLAADGRLVISGPTESALYRLGRRIAGFSGHYHKQTVYDVEAAAARWLGLEKVAQVPPLVPLFRLSVWRRAGAPGRSQST